MTNCVLDEYDLVQENEMKLFMSKPKILLKPMWYIISLVYQDLHVTQSSITTDYMWAPMKSLYKAQSHKQGAHNSRTLYSKTQCFEE